MYRINVYGICYNELMFLNSHEADSIKEILNWYKDSGYWNDWCETGKIFIEVFEYFLNDWSDESNFTVLSLTQLINLGFYKNYKENSIEVRRLC